MFDKWITFSIKAFTTYTKKNRVRMLQVIENASAKPPHARILTSTWKQKLSWNIFEPGYNIIIPIGVHF